MTRLVLFDIDGTILDSDGVASRAFRQALVEVFGTSGPDEGYSFAGRTDPEIARDLLLLAGLPEDRIEGGLERVWDRYLQLLEAGLQGRAASVFPGVETLITRLEQAAEGVLGLLTGNLVGGARLKLASAGFDFDRFRVGAFGSDHHDRKQLPAIAVARARHLLEREFQGKSIVIIGDTPADIACGESLGVRTIAVATGKYSAGELSACGPDFLFDSLSATNEVWAAIFS